MMRLSEELIQPVRSEACSANSDNAYGQKGNKGVKRKRQSEEANGTPSRYCTGHLFRCPGGTYRDRVSKSTRRNGGRHDSGDDNNTDRDLGNRSFVFGDVVPDVVGGLGDVGDRVPAPQSQRVHEVHRIIAGN